MHPKQRFVSAVLLALAIAAGSATGPAGAGGGRGKRDIKDEGVGTYTDPSVANQISNFTINPSMVSCGVGTIAQGQFSGPFAMLMYAKEIKSYRANPKTGIIRATGTMRSITELGDRRLEDVDHEFVAIAVDSRSGGADRFNVHFRTPFWNRGNSMCTQSSLVDGGCRFGGELVMGDVTVG